MKSLSFTNLILVALVAISILVSCKKEPKPQRHKDYMRAEFDGHSVELDHLVCIINNQGLLNISGGYKITQPNQGSILVSICNLPSIPQGKAYPLFLDTNCILLPSRRSSILLNSINDDSYVVISEQDDGFSRINLEIFNFESPQKFEAKGTFQFKGIQSRSPKGPPYPEKIVTGSFHFRYPQN